jgi:hypothetical protein
MNEQAPDQADTSTPALDQLRLIGDLLSCLDAVGYDSKDTQQLQLLLAAHLRPQAGRPFPGPEVGGQVLLPEPDEAILDSLDVATLIARSSLGAPPARRIRYQTSATRIAEILHRRGQVAATGHPPAHLAEARNAKSANTAAVLAEDQLPNAATRPRQRHRWSCRTPPARNLPIMLADARPKLSDRIRAGLPGAQNPKRAILVAGGMAALSTSFILSRLIGADAATAFRAALAGVLISLLSWLIASIPGKGRLLRRAFMLARPIAVAAATIAAVATLVFIAAQQQPASSSNPLVTTTWPTPPPVPSSSSPALLPRITGTYTYQQAKMVYFGIFYKDPDHDAAGFGFVGVDGSNWPEQQHPFSNPSDGIVTGNSIAYPLNQGCGTGYEYTSTIKAWIYDSTGARSKPVIIHLACTT